MKLTREAILAKEDIETRTVNVPEWGGEVTVRGMTGRQRDIWEASMTEMRGKKYVPNLADARAKLIAYCVIDPDTGLLMFTYGDIEQLSQKSAAALDRIYEVAAELSGVGEKDLEELIENFGSQNGSGSSTGPQNSAARQSAASSKKQTP